MPRTWTEHAPGLAKRRSRRLLKKMRLGVFQEFGCEISAAIKANTGEDDALDLLEELIVEVLMPRDLQLGGGWRCAFIARRSPGSMTEDDRAALHTWLSNQPMIESFKVEQLQDAWYG